MNRRVIAFLLAPASYPFGVAVLNPIFGGPSEQEFTILPILFIAPVTYAVALAFGVPTYFLFRQKQFKRWWQYTAGGFVIGSAAWAAFIAAFLGTPDVKSVAEGGAIGAVSSTMFWLIAYFPVRLPFPSDEQNKPNMINGGKP